METEVEKTSNLEKTLIQNLSVAIKNDGQLDVTVVDKMEIYVLLKKYKLPSGGLNYPAIFKIPVSERIPAMAERDLAATIRIITVALTLAFETMNISRKMNAFQILDLAETIVDSASEDDVISLEDVMLFLQKLTRGEYPELYEGIDQVKFMARYNDYRDKRWEAGKLIADNKHLQYKGLGPSERTTEKDELAEHFGSLIGRMSDLKENLKDKIRENEKLKNQ